MKIKLSIAFRLFGYYFNVGNFNHERVGDKFFNTGTVHVRRFLFISWQWESRTLEQENANKEFVRMMLELDDEH